MCYKFYLFAFFFVFSVSPIYSQVTIGADTPPEDFSVLQLEGNTGGLRLNNLSTTERDALSVSGNPVATGLVIYNTDAGSMEIWDGAAWVRLSQLGATNGLALTNNTIRLGGTLLNTTTIDLSVNNLNFLASTGSIGIGTSNPQAKLDIEGDLRLGNVSAIPSGASVLVRNNSTGVVGTVQQMILTISNVAPGATGSVAMTSAFTTGFGFLTVSASNSCLRSMNAIFNAVVSTHEFGTSIAYTNGMARDIVGQATRVNAYSYQVVFPNVAGCADGGNGTQFDFTINTSAAGQIAITNNGNVARTYTVKLSQTL